MDEFKNLVNFISHETGIPVNDLQDEASIEDDLGVTGEEAVQLILNISKVFNIKISDFSFEKYFHPEPSLFVKFNKLNKLNIFHLKQALSIGELKDQDIQ